MYGLNIIQLVSSIIMLLAIGYYIFVLFKGRDDKRIEYLFAHSSQITFLSFVLGFGILLVQEIVDRVSVTSILLFGAILAIINVLSILFYKRQR